MYADTKAIVEQGCATFRGSVHGFRFGRARIPYPRELQHLPPFPQWRQERVGRDVRAAVDVDEMLMLLAYPPTTDVIIYQSCFAYGCYCRATIYDTTGGFATYDSGIAMIREQGSRASVANQNIREGTLSYVGVLRKILEVRYGNLPLVVFKGSWVLPDVNGCVTIKRGKLACGWLIFGEGNMQRHNHMCSLCMFNKFFA